MTAIRDIAGACLDSRADLAMIWCVLGEMAGFVASVAGAIIWPVTQDLIQGKS